MLPQIVINDQNNYLSCIVVNDEPTTDSLKVLMCPHSIVQFLQSPKNVYMLNILPKNTS